MTRKKGETLLEELKREREELKNNRVYQFLNRTGIGDLLIPLSLILGMVAPGMCLVWG